MKTSLTKLITLSVEVKEHLEVALMLIGLNAQSREVVSAAKESLDYRYFNIIDAYCYLSRLRNK